MRIIINPIDGQTWIVKAINGVYRLHQRGTDNGWIFARRFLSEEKICSAFRAALVKAIKDIAKEIA